MLLGDTPPWTNGTSVGNDSAARAYSPWSLQSLGIGNAKWQPVPLESDARVLPVLDLHGKVEMCGEGGRRKVSTNVS